MIGKLPLSESRWFLFLLAKNGVRNGAYKRFPFLFRTGRCWRARIEVFKLADLASGMSFLSPECVIFPVYMLHLHQSEALRWQFVLKEYGVDV
jgi:hypothetical protein